LAYPQPPESKGAVKRAGEAISDVGSSDADIALVDQWRASHGYVINTFQAMLRKRIVYLGVDVDFAQRLKRRRTVIDKLKRKDPAGRKLISDVSSMHDFAGCRLIFKDMKALTTFREFMHSPAGMKDVEHKLRYKDPEKYNYIEHPKGSGYRGIHDVYRHYPRGSARREKKKPWDGLMVEVQYRTQVQHAWATAVEISDLLDGERTKFELDPTDRGRFFAIASEIIARREENLCKAFLETSNATLLAELHALEDRLGVLRRLKLLKQFEDEDKLSKHNVLNIYLDDKKGYALEVLPFKTAAQAIQKAGELEANEKSVNSVYVRADKPAQLRSAYRNYFYDPVDFVQMVEGH
jgi:GTP pyrophosphokinase